MENYWEISTYSFEFTLHVRFVMDPLKLHEGYVNVAKNCADVCILSCVNLYIHPPEYWRFVANLESDLIRQPAG